jgi:hypothetical protein
MTCLICARPTLPGATLCVDCRSARKRAFAATVTQPLLAAARAKSGARLLKPSQSVAATARRAAESVRTDKPHQAEPTKLWSRRTDLVLIAAAVATILGAGAFAAHRLNVAKAETAQAVDEGDAAERSAQPASGSAAETTTQSKLLPDPTVRAADEHRTGTAASDPPARVDAPKRTSPRQRTTPAEASAPVEPAVTAQAPAPAPVAAAAVETREAPKPDRWQLMTQDLASCSGDLFDRILCGQRVRRQFCDGYWGQVPQCSRPDNDHGQ